MENLNELIGQEVSVIIYQEEEDLTFKTVKCKVKSISIEDFYFENGHEPIYVTVNAIPIGEIPKDIDEDDFMDIPLENIRR